MLSDDVTSKLRASLERANHLGSPQAEPGVLTMVYRLMASYALDERVSPD